MDDRSDLFREAVAAADHAMLELVEAARSAAVARYAPLMGNPHYGFGATLTPRGQEMLEQFFREELTRRRHRLQSLRKGTTLEPGIHGRAADEPTE